MSSEGSLLSPQKELEGNQSLDSFLALINFILKGQGHLWITHTSVRVILIHYFPVNFSQNGALVAVLGLRERGLELQEEPNVGVACRQESVRQRVPEGLDFAFCEFCCSGCPRNLSF